MKFHKLIIFILFFQIIYTINLSGVVYDINNKRIRDVSIVLLEDNSFNTTTDSNGEFLIVNIDLFSCTLEASHLGFKTYINEINLNQVSLLELILQPKILDLDRIVVTGTRSERHIKDTPMLTHVIGSEDISFSSYSNAKDILEMAMPNVQSVTSNHGNDRVKIQGLDNKYLTFLIDGERISGEFAGNLDFSMLGLSNVKRIEVIEGAMSTLYGSGSVGGVVNIITKNNNEPYWVDIGMQYENPIGISSYLNTGFNKGILNYNLNMQFTNSDGYDLSPDSDEVYNMTLDENKAQILNHRLVISPSKKNIITLMYKNYSSKINRYNYFAGNLIVDAPLNRYNDKYYKLKYEYKISKNQSFKLSYIEEDYSKYYYYTYYYSGNQYIVAPEEFLNAFLNHQELNIQYTRKDLRYNRLVGLESSNQNYSSYNILYPNGDILQESIFNGEDKTNNNNNVSLYFYEERNFLDNKTLSFGLRVLNKPNIVLPSISYLIRGNNHYNYRFSYSGGYRKPSIKERYYNWQDHAGPDIIGNPNLKATKNNYFTISFDKRSQINDFSLDLYKNNISNMISTEYNVFGDLLYINYNNVVINGLNVHYSRKIQSNLKLKFVYNLTGASSSSSEILEGISKHALRLNLYYSLSNNLDIIANIKYSGEKFIFDQEQDFVGNPSIIELPSYSIADLYMSYSYGVILFKTGIKNIFDYKDPARFSSDILNTYDPGRRIFIEMAIGLKGGE